MSARERAYLARSSRADCSSRHREIKIQRPPPSPTDECVSEDREEECARVRVSDGRPLASLLFHLSLSVCGERSSATSARGKLSRSRVLAPRRASARGACESIAEIPAPVSRRRHRRLQISIAHFVISHINIIRGLARERDRERAVRPPSSALEARRSLDDVSRDRVERAESA